MSARRYRTDPRLIRHAVDYAEVHGAYAAHRELGVGWRSVRNWLQDRRAHGAGWPTEAMEQAWLDERARRPDRARKEHEYRVRRYTNGGAPLMIDPTGTRRRIHALQALGWPLWAIALHGPWKTPRAVHSLTLSERVLPSTAAVVAEIYDLLSMIPGPSPITARRAATAGWTTPLGWDDRTIDDPKTLPATYVLADTRRRVVDLVDEAVVLRVIRGERVPATKAERIEVVRRWDALGRPRRELEKRTGWKVERYGLLEVAS